MLALLVSFTRFVPRLKNSDRATLKGLNIGADREAAEHFLSALQLQKSNSGETSDSLWSTLRKAFYGMVSLGCWKCSECPEIYLLLGTVRSRRSCSA